MPKFLSVSAEDEIKGNMITPDALSSHSKGSGKTGNVKRCRERASCKQRKGCGFTKVARQGKSVNKTGGDTRGSLLIKVIHFFWNTLQIDSDQFGGNLY